MTPLTALPLRTAASQYRTPRLPYLLFEAQVVGRLDDTSPLRLGYESAVGRLDATVGRLTGDRELAEHGGAALRRVQVLRTRSAVLARADRLGVKAQTRRDEAEQTLQAEHEWAERGHAQAREAARNGVQFALDEERAEKQRVTADADAAARAEGERAEAEADRRSQAAVDRLRADQQRIAGQEQAGDGRAGGAARRRRAAGGGRRAAPGPR